MFASRVLLHSPITPMACVSPVMSQVSAFQCTVVPWPAFTTAACVPCQLNVSLNWYLPSANVTPEVGAPATVVAPEAPVSPAPSVTVVPSGTFACVRGKPNPCQPEHPLT